VNESWGVEHGVIDDDTSSSAWSALSEIALLRLNVPAHGGVLGVWNRAVSHRHPLCGHFERDIEKH